MTASATSNQVRFSIERFEAWAPGVQSADEWAGWLAGDLVPANEGEPPLKQMPPMLRRHAARLGRMTCDVAYRALAGLPDGSLVHDVPMVFASRYGEVDRSVDLLSALGRDGSVSPTSFGLSVHNAINGLFAMARNDRSNSIAVAAGDESAECGVIEACNLLDDGAEAVLLVVADCPVPEVYARFVDTAPAALAWAALVRPRSDTGYALSREPARTTHVTGERAPTQRLPMSGLEFSLRFLLSEEKEKIRTSGAKVWRWCRDA